MAIKKKGTLSGLQSKAAPEAAPTPGAGFTIPDSVSHIWLAGLGAVFGLQCLAGFPQTAYASATSAHTPVATSRQTSLPPGGRAVVGAHSAAPDGACPCRQTCRRWRGRSAGGKGQPSS